MGHTCCGGAPCDDGADEAFVIHLEALNEAGASDSATAGADAVDQGRKDLLRDAATAPAHVEAVLVLQRCKPHAPRRHHHFTRKLSSSWLHTAVLQGKCPACMHARHAAREHAAMLDGYVITSDRCAGVQHGWPLLPTRRPKCTQGTRGGEEGPGRRAHRKSRGSPWWRRRRAFPGAQTARRGASA